MDSDSDSPKYRGTKHGLEPARRSSRKRQCAAPPAVETMSPDEERQLKAALRNSVHIKKREVLPVPDAPVFRPTEEEFADVIGYLESINPTLMAHGIVKIIPPAGWAPPGGLLPATAWNYRVEPKLQALHHLQEGQAYGFGERQSIAEYKSKGDAFVEQNFPWLDTRLFLNGTGPAADRLNRANVEIAGARAAQVSTKTTTRGGAAGSSPSPAAGSPQVDSARESRHSLPAVIPNGPPPPVPSTREDMEAAIERTYWDAVEVGAQNIEVEYANDIDSLDCGSGFPSLADGVSRADRLRVLLEGQKSNVPCDFSNPAYYAQTGWNLHNIALQPRSPLRYLPELVKGINVPWLYCGMLFATFAWHTEDNYLYSVNYMHLGAPKSWYGIPPADAEAFEREIKSHALQRFRETPDLLYHLVTMLPPSILLKAGVRVVHTVQHAGEFIITCPQAYHAGFSHGFNVGEAVNFALNDWIRFGRSCVERYRMRARPSVLSFDEIMFKLAAHAETLNSSQCLDLLFELENLRSEEIWLRSSLKQRGLQHALHLTNDADKRLDCCICKHTCYISTVVCHCSTHKVACLRHATQLCSCSTKNQLLVYWHSIRSISRHVAKVLERIRQLEGPEPSDFVGDMKRQLKFNAGRSPSPTSSTVSDTDSAGSHGPRLELLNPPASGAPSATCAVCGASGAPVAPPGEDSRCTACAALIQKHLSSRNA